MTSLWDKSKTTIEQAYKKIYPEAIVISTFHIEGGYNKFLCKTLKDTIVFVDLLKETGYTDIIWEYVK